MREGIIRSLEGKLDIFDDIQHYKEHRIEEDDDNFENDTQLHDEDIQEFQPPVNLSE